MTDIYYIKPSSDEIASGTGMTAEVFESIPSTNSALIERIKSGDASPKIYAAVSQSAGRGRLGRSFSSECGGVYFSFCFSLPAKEAPEKAHLMTPLAGVAVTSALTELYSIDVGLKWVNDIISGGKKLGGILSEAVTVGGETHIVVGIGINAVNTDFPDTATSLSLVRGGTFDASEIISRTVNAFFSRLSDVKNIHREYRSRLVHLGSHVLLHRFDGTPDIRVTALDVNEDCLLLVSDESGRIFPVSSGEVSIFIEK